jgi:hypothetical protein
MADPRGNSVGTTDTATMSATAQPLYTSASSTGGRRAGSWARARLPSLHTIGHALQASAMRKTHIGYRDVSRNGNGVELSGTQARVAPAANATTTTTT